MTQRWLSNRKRTARSLVTIILLTFIQVGLAPIGLPSLIQETSATDLYPNRSNFLQWDNWQSTSNHVPWWNENKTEITSNGDGIQLTQNQNSQYGALWNTQSISLANDFAISATYYFGALNRDAGADGIMFLLQPQSQWPNGGTSGSSSGGAAFWQRNQLRVYFDTYQNGVEIDNDHVMVQVENGQGQTTTYSKTGNKDGVALYDSSGNELTNVENNGYYPFTIKWLAKERTLTIYGGANSDRSFHSVTIPASDFDGTNFSWGWQGSTGGENNYQSINNVKYHIGPTVNSATSGSVTKIVGDQVTFESNYTSREGTATIRWEYSTDSGSTWISTGNTSTSYTFTAERPLNQRQYRFYVETNALGSVLTAKSTPITLTVNALSASSETDTAFSLTGTQYAWQSDTGTGGVFDITGAITLEAWVYPTETGTAQYTVICKSEAYQLFHKDGVWKYSLWGSSNWGSGISTNVPVRINEWHHIAITRAASTNVVNFYYDGFLVYDGTANTASTGTISDSSFQFGIGGMIYGGPSLQYPFKGSIDHVALFSTVRDQATIKLDMHSYLSPTTSGLRAFYDFNEGNGSTTVYNRVLDANSSTFLKVVGSAAFQDIKQETTTSTSVTVKFPRSYLTAMGGWRTPAGVSKVQALVIGGGGGGGSRAGGGGGAGLYVYDNSLTLTPNRVETITVGQGGVSSLTGGSSGSGIFEGIYGGQGNNGQDSRFSIYTIVDGGGGGGGAAGLDNTWRNGLSGGSGGGASGNYNSSIASASPGGFSKGLRGYGLGSQGGSGKRDNDWPAGGGGGAGYTGGMGGTPDTNLSKAGSGGTGILDPIGGTSLCYAAGGGAGTLSTSSGGGGDAGTCPGGVATASAGTKGASSPSAATANSGSGGGGSGWNASGDDVLGGSGGSGVIIIKYLVTSAKPIFSGPSNDTTTAGLTATFTVTGNPASPFVRTYQWLISTDTGTSWSNATSGTGATSASYTTQVLTTSLSGSRYQYSVVVTDTDGGLVMRETSTAVYLIINPAITFTGTYTIQKYGVTHTDTFTTTVGTGTGNKTFAFTPNNRSFITWDTSTANTAALTVSRFLGPGTYYETMTATDTKGAQTSQMISIVVSKADTITVSALSVSDTYTGSALNFANRYSISGLVNSDTVTAISYNYAGTANGGANYSSSATRPVNAGSYSITPSATIANSDSYTAVVVETSTLTINRATRSILISTKPLSLKYGSSSTLGVTTDGDVDGTITYTSNTTSLCSFASATLTAIASSGNCTYFARISQGNNYETATSSTATTTLAKADTLTVTVNPIPALTYSAAQAVVTPTVTVSGLKFSDTFTANLVNYQYGTITVTGGVSSTSWELFPPTDADLYTVHPYALQLSSGSRDDYEGITYVDGSLRINRAQQPALALSQYSAVAGQAYTLQFFGGAGTGALSATASAGTAQNCSISGISLTATSSGSCWVVAQKNGDKNYETQTAGFYVYFLEWLAPSAVTIITNSPTVALDSTVSITRTSGVAPLVTTVASSGDATYPVAISGQGFTDDTLANTKVRFWRGVEVPAGDYIIKSNTLIWSKVPAGATRGRIIVANTFGSGASTTTFSP